MAERRITPDIVRSVFGLSGLVILFTGTWLEFGPGWACIIAGALMFSVVIAGVFVGSRG